MKCRIVDFFFIFSFCIHAVWPLLFCCSLEDAGLTIVWLFVFSLFLSCNYYLLRKVWLYDGVFMRCRGQKIGNDWCFAQHFATQNHRYWFCRYCWSWRTWMMSGWAILVGSSIPTRPFWHAYQMNLRQIVFDFDSTIK